MAKERIGIDKPEEATKVLLDLLDSRAVASRRPWFYEIADEATADGSITEVQRKAMEPILAMGPLHGMWTPFETAGKEGILSPELARELHQKVTRRLHSEEAKCEGTGKYHYDGEDAVIENAELSTDVTDQNIVRATGGSTVTIRNCTLKKDGEVTDHMRGNFTGLNAGILAENGTVIVENSKLTSVALGGNGVFAHGPDSKIILKEVMIDSYGEGACRSVYCAFGGQIEAENCEFISRGTISSTVATDAGSGKVNLKSCLVKAMGSNCASLYSTGDIYAENCMCLAPETEGLIIAGDDILRLKDTYVLSGRSQGVKINGRKEGGYFRMEGGILAVCEGPIVFSCGSARIYLDNARIANPSGIAFNANSYGLHMERPDGGDPSELNIEMHRQLIEGDSFSDKNHRLILSLADGSRYIGAVNGNQASVYCEVTLSADSQWELTGNSYVHQLHNACADQSNIILNGYQLVIG